MTKKYPAISLWKQTSYGMEFEAFYVVKSMPQGEVTGNFFLV